MAEERLPQASTPMEGEKMDQLYLITDKGINKNLPQEIRRNIQSGNIKSGLLKDKPENASVLIWDPMDAPVYEAMRIEQKKNGIRQRPWYYRQYSTGYLVICF